MDVTGTVTFEFGKVDGHSVGRHKIEGEVPVDTLIAAMENLKFQLHMRRAMEMQAQQMQEAQKKLVLPTGHFPGR